MSHVDRVRTGGPSTPIRNGGVGGENGQRPEHCRGDLLVVALFLLDYAVQAATWNDIVAGVLALALAWGRLSNARFSPGLSWTNALLGIRLVLAPFVLRYSVHSVPLWNDVIVGVIVASLAAWSAVATPRRAVAG